MKYPDIDAALEDAMERLEQIEKILSEDGITADGFDKRLEALERLTQHTCEALGRDGVAGRLEALEERLETHAAVFRADGVTADGFDKRIRELEARCQEVAGAALEALRDRDRQDRWHQTYDALAPVFVGRCIGAATLGDTLEETKQRMEWAIVHGHKLTGWYCDRAHGRLEIVVPAGTTFDEAALAKGGKFVSQPGWSQWDAKVDDPLEDALKPFEASRGGE